MPKPSVTNRRFVNVYEIDFKTVQSKSGSIEQMNSVRCIATHVAKDHKEAKEAFKLISKADNYKHNRFSVQLQDFDARHVYNAIF